MIGPMEHALMQLLHQGGELADLQVKEGGSGRSGGCPRQRRPEAHSQLLVAALPSTSYPHDYSTGLAAQSSGGSACDGTRPAVSHPHRKANCPLVGAQTHWKPASLGVGRGRLQKAPHTGQRDGTCSARRSRPSRQRHASSARLVAWSQRPIGRSCLRRCSRSLRPPPHEPL